MKTAFDCFAIALASIVLPVPGINMSKGRGREREGEKMEERGERREEDRRRGTRRDRAGKDGAYLVGHITGFLSGLTKVDS